MHEMPMGWCLMYRMFEVINGGAITGRLGVAAPVDGAVCAGGVPHRALQEDGAGAQRAAGAGKAAPAGAAAVAAAQHRARRAAAVSRPGHARSAVAASRRRPLRGPRGAPHQPQLVAPHCRPCSGWCRCSALAAAGTSSYSTLGVSDKLLQMVLCTELSLLPKKVQRCAWRRSLMAKCMRRNCVAQHLRLQSRSTLL